MSLPMSSESSSARRRSSAGSTSVRTVTQSDGSSATVVDDGRFKTVQTTEGLPGGMKITTTTTTGRGEPRVVGYTKYTQSSVPTMAGVTYVSPTMMPTLLPLQYRPLLSPQTTTTTTYTTTDYSALNPMLSPVLVSVDSSRSSEHSGSAKMGLATHTAAPTNVQTPVQSSYASSETAHKSSPLAPENYTPAHLSAYGISSQYAPDPLYLKAVNYNPAKVTTSYLGGAYQYHAEPPVPAEVSIPAEVAMDVVNTSIGSLDARSESFSSQSSDEQVPQPEIRVNAPNQSAQVSGYMNLSRGQDAEQARSQVNVNSFIYDAHGSTYGGNAYLSSGMTESAESSFADKVQEASKNSCLGLSANPMVQNGSVWMSGSDLGSSFGSSAISGGEAYDMGLSFSTHGSATKPVGGPIGAEAKMVDEDTIDFMSGGSRWRQNVNEMSEPDRLRLMEAELERDRMLKLEAVRLRMEEENRLRVVNEEMERIRRSEMEKASELEVMKSSMMMMAESSQMSDRAKLERERAKTRQLEAELAELRKLKSKADAEQQKATSEICASAALRAKEADEMTELLKLQEQQAREQQMKIIKEAAAMETGAGMVNGQTGGNKSWEAKLREFQRQQDIMMRKLLDEIDVRKMMNNAHEYISVVNNPFKSLIIKLNSVFNLLKLKESNSMSGKMTPYCDLSVGDKHLSCRGLQNNTLTEFLSMSMCHAPESLEFKMMDLFHFPYANEKYLRLKFGLVERPSNNKSINIDHCLGYSVLDLETLITDPSLLGTQTLDLYEDERSAFAALSSISASLTMSGIANTPGLAPGRAVGKAAVDVNMTPDFIELPFIALKGNQMSKEDLMLSQSIRTAMKTGNMASVQPTKPGDCLVTALKQLDITHTNLVHPFRSLRIGIIELQDFIMTCAKLTPMFQFKSIDQTVTTDAIPSLLLQQVGPRQTVTVGKELWLPYKGEKLGKLVLLNSEFSSPPDNIYGKGSLDIQKLLMSGHFWFLREVQLMAPNGNQVAVAKISVELLYDKVPKTMTRNVESRQLKHAVYSVRKQFNGHPRQIMKHEKSVLQKSKQFDLLEELSGSGALPMSLQVIVRSLRLAEHVVSRYKDARLDLKLGGNSVQTTGVSPVDGKAFWRLHEACFTMEFKSSVYGQVLTMEAWEPATNAFIGVALFDLDCLRQLPNRLFNGGVKMQDENGKVSAVCAISCQLM